jgi:WD40 repeat protein
MQKDENSDAINFRYTTGFSLDFQKNDTIMYFVATEDGTIHRCSKSYKESYLENYYGHTGPVYKVRCNPFWPDVGLTASADWTCRVWNWKEDSVTFLPENFIGKSCLPKSGFV